ncbi:cutinase-domain-containing protein [Mycena olivaceomarginata]|nr:cutinase-domain-containing protein [Mycena olivaceomarginata]
MALRIALSFLIASAAAYPHDPGLKREEILEVGLRVAQNSTVPDESSVTGAVSGMEEPSTDLLMDLSAGGGECADVIVIFARGTSEAKPIGERVGPQLNDTLTKQLNEMNKTLSFTGVDYPADYIGFLIITASTQCPNASIVPAGYSQGAQLVHNAVKQFSAAVLKRIKALVTFGDPDKFYRIEGVPTDKILIICHDADIVCSGIPLLALLLLLGSSEHLDYDENVGTAADFILGRVFL